jgi:hypothetical protein
MIKATMADRTRLTPQLLFTEVPVQSQESEPDIFVRVIDFVSSRLFYWLETVPIEWYAFVTCSRYNP